MENLNCFSSLVLVGHTGLQLELTVAWHCHTKATRVPLLEDGTDITVDPTRCTNGFLTFKGYHLLLGPNRSHGTADRWLTLSGSLGLKTLMSS